MNSKIEYKRDKGITLIALVVTIIVLLILAGISINALAGQNGILNRTTSAKQKTEEAQVQEELETGLMGLFMDYQVEAGGLGTFADYIFANEAKVQSELGGNVGIDSTNKTITYKGTLFSVADDGKVTRKDGIGISGDKTTITIIGNQKETATLTATLTNISGTVTWTSTNTGVATVTGNGTTATVSPVAAGTTTIKAKCSEKEASYEITVKQIKKATILSIKTLTKTEIEEGEKIEITALQDGNDEIVWTASDTSKVTITSKDENTAIVTGKAASDTAITITATAKNSGITPATCRIKVKAPSYIGQYVEYDVAYTDMYTLKEGENTINKQYTKENGWRILSMKQSAVSGAYDIEIVSTGVPAILYYSSGSVANAAWAGKADKQINGQTVDQLTKYATTYYGTVGNNNLIAASGLAYNFAEVTFKGNSQGSANTGYYTRIAKNNGTEVYTGDGKAGNELFVARAGATVRSMMHTDVPNVANSITSYSDIQSKTGADTTGLFRLDKLGYTNSAYWLASPNPDFTSNVCIVNDGGSVDGGSSYYYGVRPVVSMSGVTMQKTTTTDGTTLWKITN